MDRLNTALLALVLSALAVAPVRAVSAAETPPDSWWDVDFDQDRFRATVGLAADLTLRDYAPAGTSFLGGSLGADIRLGYWVRPWLAVDAGAVFQGGSNTGFMGEGLSSRFDARFSGGVTLALPTRIAPYVGARLGYAYERIRWDLTGDGTQTGTVSSGALFGRLEAGGVVRLTDNVELILGVHADADIARSDLRVEQDAAGTAIPVAKLDLGGDDTDSPFRSIGVDMMLQLRF